MIVVTGMTLSAQLEWLRHQRTQELQGISNSLPSKAPGSSAGEFSFLRRKLAQFRSGKWRKSGDGNSMVRSQSWNNGLQSTGPAKLNSDWSSSLTSLREGETLSHDPTALGGLVEVQQPSLARSQSVYHKQELPQEVVKLRTKRKVKSKAYIKKTIDINSTLPFWACLKQNWHLFIKKCLIKIKDGTIPECTTRLKFLGIPIIRHNINKQ